MPPFKHRIFFHACDVIQALHDTIDERLAHLWMGNFAPSERDRDFHLVAAFEQLGRRARLEVDVVVIDLRLHAHFAELHVLLVLLRLTVLLRLLVLEPAKVHEPRDRRACASGNLDEVDIALPRHRDRFARADNANLRAVLVDQANFGDPDPLIRAGLRRCGLRWCFRSFPQTTASLLQFQKR